MNPRLFLLLAVCSAPLNATAQRPAESIPETLPGRIYLYSEPDFRGDSLLIEEQTVLTNLRDQRRPGGKRWDDAVSSVRIEGRVRLTLFADPRQRGERLELTRNVRDLRAEPSGPRGEQTWDDRASSLTVVTRVHPSGPIEDARGGRVPEFTSARAADRAIRQAYADILGREPDYAGVQLYRKRLLDDAWSQEQLREHLRRSDEFRNRDPDDVIRRAYRDVLNREPDAEGLAAFRSYVVDRGWTDGEVRAELRRSHEATSEQSRKMITRAFRELLGRDPDAQGLASYVKQVNEHGWTEERVRDAIRASDEFKNRPRR